MAIAFDAVSSSGDGVSTWNHTVTGTNPLLLVFYYDRNSSVTAMSYNGVGMALVGSKADQQGGGTVYCYKLGAPATGLHSIVVTGPTGAGAGHGLSYTGASATIDSSLGTNGAPPLSANTTVVLANCWIVGGFGSFNTGGAVSSNRTDRANTNFFTASYNILVSDSNAIVATGSQGFTFTAGSATGSGAFVVSISPFVAQSSFPPRVKTLQAINRASTY